VAEWWEPPADLEREFLDSGDPVRFFVALLGDRPVGMIQVYRWSDFPAEAAAVSSRPGEAGIDFLIGERELIGRGLGPELIDAFLRAHVWPEADVTGVRVDVAPANRRSRRCLEKLGFAHTGLSRPGPGSPARTEPHDVYVLSASRPRVSAPAPARGRPGSRA
jgi:aminoglycoside 6'-N-acetyltransferase